MLAALLCGLGRGGHGHDAFDVAAGDYSAWLKSAQRRKLRKPEQVDFSELVADIEKLMRHTPPELVQPMLEQIQPEFKSEGVYSPIINWDAYLTDLGNLNRLIDLYDAALRAEAQRRKSALQLLTLRALAASEEADRQAVLQFLEMMQEVASANL